MLPNHPYNFSYFSNETTQSLRVPMQHTFINNYQIHPSETETPSRDSISCPVRKRTNRTDRHSKIRTAQGERDRRMRLSVQVARDFFSLQDKLGFDKASQTLDWLLNQAKESIDQIKTTSDLPNSDEKATIANQTHRIIPEKMKNIAPCSDQGVSVTKESRDKARRRARERAKEKKTKKGIYGKLEQVEMASNSAVSPNDQGTEGSWGGDFDYFYYLSDILNVNFDGCGMEIEDEKGGFMSGTQFNN